MECFGQRSGGGLDQVGGWLRKKWWRWCQGQSDHAVNVMLCRGHDDCVPGEIDVCWDVHGKNMND